MYRNNYKKYVPSCPKTVPVVDQYLWKERDTNEYTCNNGVSHPIYDCKGDVSFTLPLEMYPPGGEIHPQIALSNRMHFNYRMSPDIAVELQDIIKGNEGYHPSMESYDASANPMQYHLLDQGSFDLDVPSFFHQPPMSKHAKEGYYMQQETNQRPCVPGYPCDAPSQPQSRPITPPPTPLYHPPMLPLGGREGYGNTNPIQYDLLDQGSFDLDAPPFFHQPQRRPSIPTRRQESSMALNMLSPWNPDLFSQRSERFSNIPTPSSDFPLQYQSPLMQQGYTLRTPYGIRPGSECKGLYGF